MQDFKAYTISLLILKIRHPFSFEILLQNFKNLEVSHLYVQEIKPMET
jgi:hypothetical protein